MNNPINCARCFSLTVQMGKSNLCQKCQKVDNAWLEIVLDYLRKRENRTATIVQVLNATLVNEEWVYEWVKQGKILQRHFPNIGLPCPKCGENLTDGVSVCLTCKGKLVRSLEEINSEEEQRTTKNSSAYLHSHNE